MTVVEDRPIMSVNHCLPAIVFYFWRKLYRTLQRGLSAIAEHLVYLPVGQHLYPITIAHASAPTDLVCGLLIKTDKMAER